MHLGELVIQMNSKGSWREFSSLALQASLFVIFRSSTDWMRLTHIMEGNLQFSMFANLNVNIIPKHLLGYEGNLAEISVTLSIWLIWLPRWVSPSSHTAACVSLLKPCVVFKRMTFPDKEEDHLVKHIQVAVLSC